MLYLIQLKLRPDFSDEEQQEIIMAVANSAMMAGPCQGMPIRRVRLIFLLFGYVGLSLTNPIRSI